MKGNSEFKIADWSIRFIRSNIEIKIHVYSNVSDNIN